jgi:hypothetical protein
MILSVTLRMKIPLQCLPVSPPLHKQQGCRIFRHSCLPYGNPFYDNDSIGSRYSQRVYAFISYFEIQARFLSGNATTALDYIRRTYGWMANNDLTTTFWEGIGTNGSMYEGAYTSAACGWSTGVLPALTSFILSAMPTGPRFQT